MIIFYDWDKQGQSGQQDGRADHTGIVWKVENGYVYTIEGNLSDKCMVNEQLSNCISILRIKGKNQCYFADFFNKKCNLFHFCTLYNRMSYQRINFLTFSLHRCISCYI